MIRSSGRAWQDATVKTDQERQPGVVSAERETGLEPATLGLGTRWLAKNRV